LFSNNFKLYFDTLENVDSVVHLYSWYTDSSAYYLAMERPGKMDLCDYLIHNQCTLNEQQALVVFRQLVDIAYRCAEMDIVHRDLKEDNLILCSESTLTVKAIDFGSATSISANTPSTEYVGTKEYFAPEQRLRLPYDPLATTVYSLGAILYSLTQGQPPPQRGPILFKRQLLSSTTRELILRCVSAVPNDRPSLRDLQALQTSEETFYDCSSYSSNYRKWRYAYMMSRPEFGTNAGFGLVV